MKVEAIAISMMWLLTGLIVLLLKREGIPAKKTVSLSLPGIALFVAGYWAVDLGYRPQDFFAYGVFLWIFLLAGALFSSQPRKQK